jgi:glycosyltransferase involved in cell wall biosynthesis
MSKISVIMAVYNSEKYIRESVESILNQTFGDFELLAIFDSGTIDSSPAILEEYRKQDKRVKPIDMGENGGLINSLNYGIKISNGEYIARMDSDDICILDRFEKQVKYLDEHSDISILGTNIYFFDNMGHIGGGWSPINITDDTALQLAFQGAIVANPSTMMRRSIFDVLTGYEERQKEAEDFDLWLRAARYGFKIRCLPERLVKYRLSSTSKSATAKDMKYYVTLSRIHCINSINQVKKYVIWGSGDIANSLYELIKNNFNNMELIGYISANPEKYTESNSSKIYAPEKIPRLDADFVFIANPSSNERPESYLIQFGCDYAYVL